MTAVALHPFSFDLGTYTGIWKSLDAPPYIGVDYAMSIKHGTFNNKVSSRLTQNKSTIVMI